MQTRVTTLLDDLTRLARDVELAAVAVSGGVDSVTLASVVHRALGGKFTAYHATSPAVPPQATERVREHAEREGWALEVVDAREFEDPQYLANPRNRCYFCKRICISALPSILQRRCFPALTRMTWATIDQV